MQPEESNRSNYGRRDFNARRSIDGFVTRPIKKPAIQQPQPQPQQPVNPLAETQNNQIFSRLFIINQLNKPQSISLSGHLKAHKVEHFSRLVILTNQHLTLLRLVFPFLINQNLYFIKKKILKNSTK
jgi:hypothetical protein